MEIKIGDIVLGGESRYNISPGVEGLDAPEFRLGNALYAGRDGGFVSGHFYGNRTIVISGFYIGNSCEDIAELGMNLFNLLHIRRDLPIVITLSSGKQYYTEGRVTDVKSDIENLRATEFQITLLCPDPVLYESEDGEAVWYTQILDDGTNDRNLLDSTRTNGVIVGGTGSYISIPTGVRVYRDGGSWVGVRFLLGARSDFVGKTLTLSCKIGEATSPTWCYYIGGNSSANLNGSYTSHSVAASTNNKTSTTYTVEPSSTYPYLYVQFYGLYGGDAPTGDCYVDYENIMLSVSGVAEDYVPYSANVTTTVKNEGDVEIYPIIISAGQATELEYSNDTLEQTMQIAANSTTSDTITTDMDSRLITMNGKAINQTRSLLSSWWYLRRENNEITVQGATGGSVDAGVDYIEGQFLKGFDYDTFVSNSSALGFNADDASYIQVDYDPSLSSPFTLKVTGETGILYNKTYAINSSLALAFARLGFKALSELVNKWMTGEVSKPSESFSDVLRVNAGVKASTIIKYRKGFAGI